MDELDIKKSILALTKRLKNIRSISQFRMDRPMDRPYLEALANEICYLTSTADDFLNLLQTELDDLS